MKSIKSFFILLGLALLGTACETTPEPTPTPTPEPEPEPELYYYAQGNGADDPTDVWMHGENWKSYSYKNYLEGDTIVFKDVPAGEWEFILTEGTKNKYGYSNVSRLNSTPNFQESTSNRVLFKTIEPATIFIAWQNDSIVLRSTAPFYTQNEYEAMWPDKIVDDNMGTFIKVNKGSFMMGNDASTKDNEKPAHKVTFTKSFYIATLELTQEEWMKVMSTNPSDIKGDKLPLNNATLGEVLDFIRELNELTGRTFRLPTEAEWEYAARGGQLSQNFTYSGSNDVNEVAWYAMNSEDNLQQGGQKKANELGLFDMSGNVAEWCADKLSEYPNKEVEDPYQTYGAGNAVRGGQFEAPAAYLTNTTRLAVKPTDHFYNTGFRLVISEPDADELIKK